MEENTDTQTTQADVPTELQETTTTTSTATTSEVQDETTDIFLWANQTDARKNDLDIELFFVL